MITCNGKVISKEEIVCTSFCSHIRGLMFRKQRNLIMEFSTPRKINLHMWFVFFPIDVLVLDSSKKIVEIKKNFRPFTFWSSRKKGQYVIELGFPKKCKVGDRVKW